MEDNNRGGRIEKGHISHRTVMNPRGMDFGLSVTTAKKTCTVSYLLPQCEFNSSPRTSINNMTVSHGDQTGESHGELCSSTLTNFAHIRSKMSGLF